jgi:hypothetical protein
MKSSTTDLGPVTVDLSTMKDINAGDPEGSHRVVSGSAVTEIKVAAACCGEEERLDDADGGVQPATRTSADKEP